MSVEEKKAVVRRFVEEVYNKGNLNAVDELVAEAYVDHAQNVQGRAAVKEIVSSIRAAFPDLQVTIEDMVAEGDTVAVRTRSTHTHRGHFMGIPPTGVEGSHTGMAFIRIVDGQVVEFWEEADMLGLLQQLDAVPTPGAA